MSKPVLLLDIDGVVNSLLAKPPSMGWPKEAWREAVYESNTNEFPLLWSAPVIDYLSTLHDQDRVEIRWHTTWQEQAPEFGKIVGLPEFPVADAPEARANQGLLAKQQILKAKPVWWKYNTAERVLTDEHRPLIWIDDDLFSNVPKTYRNGLGQLGKILLLCPDGQTGLLSKHLRQIEEVLLLWEEARGALSGS